MKRRKPNPEIQEGHSCNLEGHSCGCGRQGATAQQESGSALNILDARFARGEIEKTEYEEKKLLISQRAIPTVDLSEPKLTAVAARYKPRASKK